MADLTPATPMPGRTDFSAEEELNMRMARMNQRLKEGASWGDAANELHTEDGLGDRLVNESLAAQQKEIDKTNDEGQ